MNPNEITEAAQDLEQLWWIEYDSFGRDFVFDVIERAMGKLGAELPNAKYGGRAPKWGKK